MTEASDLKTPGERIEEAIREIGVLLVALAPLDASFAPSFRADLQPLLILVAIGVTLFICALWLERRRGDARISN